MRIILSDKARAHLTNGVKEAGTLAGLTYGPRGGSVVLGKRGKVIATTDGATSLRSLHRRLGLGFDLVLSTTIEIDNRWGDGTSTVAILAKAIVEAGLSSHSNPLDAAFELEREWVATKNRLSNMAISPDMAVLQSVGIRASKGDREIVDSLVEAVSEIGAYGTVVLERGIGLGIEIHITEGLSLPEKWASPNLTNDSETILEGPFVAICRGHLLKFDDVAPILEEASQWPERPIVIFAEGIRGKALDTVVMNHVKKVLTIMAIEYQGNPKGVTNWLDDIASVSNGTVYESSFMGTFQAAWLGSARKITVSQKGTTITPYQTQEVLDRIGQRIETLTHMSEATSHDYDRDQYNRRIAEMDGGLCIVKVGGATDLEAIERRGRTEDTLHALNAAMSTGVVPGAGIALAQSGTGRILEKALKVPQQILESKGGVDTPGWDPLGVVLGCLDAAISLSVQILRTGAVITSGERNLPW